ncbi:four helix bundle protein [Mesorhizobium sp. VK22B]|uniref:Four helix bundle protein n=1 Tax=Mesorhizobium captivum TaxID=3072319 RepID=A0ABU4Z1S7_9HYPH|nr:MULTISPECIES: four helix bundle protein [unclassified Mesorhizobium]MDX8493144.1 four helix bundle protein [Mesorhizobium sp. VK22B]MDX8504373.1 four helix bundle protein [Mesorhizobium sp. VK22E]
MNSYRDLIVWKAALRLAVHCCSATKAFPNREAYGMTSQVRRSAASIAANVAEGHGRENTGAFIQFLRVAQGSLKELETHLILCGEVGLMVEAEVASLLGQADEIGKMLRSMIRSLQQKL